MADQEQATPPPDIMQLWREWLTQSERQFNALFNQGMNTDAFARSFGGYIEMNAAFQRMIAEGMQRYLSFVNMPSRQDVLALGETLRALEERLTRIEELLTAEVAAPAPEPGARVSNGGLFADGGPFGQPRSYDEPPRTRRPEIMPLPNDDDIADVTDIPRELRR